MCFFPILFLDMSCGLHNFAGKFLNQLKIMKKYFIAIMLLLLASLSSLRAEDKPVILHPSSTTHGAGQGKKPRKPAHCPNWVPDTPDGDDSDYTKGPLDENGFPADIPSMIADSIIYITQDTEWSLRKYVYHKVCVYGHNLRPVINTIYRTDKYIQNEIITGTKTYRVEHNIYVGNHVTDNKPHGDVNIINADVKMQAKEVELHPGTTITNSNLEIYTSY